MKKEVLCETIERTISQPVMFDTKEQAREEMVKRFKEAMNMTDEEFEAMDDDSSECFCGENEAYCVNANHDNCDWSIFTIEDTVCDTGDTNKILTTGNVFTAEDKFKVRYKYKLLGISLERGGYICLQNLDSNTLTVVEPEWFRQRKITKEEATTMERRTYVAVIKLIAMRNAQICRADATDTLNTGRDKNWENFYRQIYLGVYVGDYDNVLNEVVDEFNIDPENIELIDADTDSRIV